MLSNKTTNVIKICMETMLAITKGETEGAKKARRDIKKSLDEFNKYIKEVEAGKREFEESFNSYIEQ